MDCANIMNTFNFKNLPWNGRSELTIYSIKGFYCEGDSISVIADREAEALCWRLELEQFDETSESFLEYFDPILALRDAINVYISEYKNESDLNLN